MSKTVRLGTIFSASHTPILQPDDECKTLLQKGRKGLAIEQKMYRLLQDLNSPIFTTSIMLHLQRRSDFQQMYILAGPGPFLTEFFHKLWVEFKKPYMVLDLFLPHNPDLLCLLNLHLQEVAERGILVAWHVVIFGR